MSASEDKGHFHAKSGQEDLSAIVCKADPRKAGMRKGKKSKDMLVNVKSLFPQTVRAERSHNSI